MIKQTNPWPLQLNVWTFQSVKHIRRLEQAEPVFLAILLVRTDCSTSTGSVFLIGQLTDYIWLLATVCVSNCTADRLWLLANYLLVQQLMAEECCCHSVGSVSMQWLCVVCMCMGSVSMQWLSVVVQYACVWVVCPCSSDCVQCTCVWVVCPCSGCVWLHVCG